MEMLLGLDPDQRPVLQLINRPSLRDSGCVGIACYAVSFLFQSKSIRDNDGGAKDADQELTLNKLFDRFGQSTKAVSEQ
ncbi:hypothetical protein SH528x_001937 [Novipirellula sp. SH528]|uniref:hypothetical protein n=1 Tax=Novipirellula sp. SH528 TaxID=3454466 RepID=UPI003F9FFB08